MTAIIHVVGNLTRDPETREAGSSTVTKLSVAHNFKVRGEKKTTFYTASVWGKQGEAAEKYLSRGSSVVVWGEHRPREFESGGTQRTSEDIENAGWGFAGAGSGGGDSAQTRRNRDDDDEDDF